MRAPQHTSLRWPGLDEHAHTAKCAAVVSDYWRRLGQPVTVWAEEVIATTPNSVPTWGVRSNLRNGLPE